MKIKKIFPKMSLLLLCFFLLIFSDAFAGNNTTEIIFMVSNNISHNVCSDCFTFFIPQSELINILTNLETQEPKEADANETEFCNYSFNTISDEIHDSTIRFSYDILPKNPTLFEITYWVEDYDGNTVRTPFVTSNTNWKQFTPSFDEQYQVFVIKSELAVPDCNNTYTTEKWAIVTNSEYEVELEAEDEEEEELSVVQIEHVYLANTLRFGKSIDVKIKFVNLGNRDSLYLYIVNPLGDVISQVIEFDVFGNSDATITQSLVLDDYCINNETASIVIEGFGDSSTKSIYLDCPNPSQVELSGDIETLKRDESAEFPNNENNKPFYDEDVNTVFTIDALLHNISNFPNLIYSAKSERSNSIFPFVAIFSIFSVAVVFMRYKL